MPRSFAGRGAALSAAVLLLAMSCGCGPRSSRGSAFVWVVGQGEPRFDPTGPAEPTRAMLEHLLGEGLVAEDTTGRIVEAAARRWDVTTDGLTYSFHLRSGLRFADGAECTSDHFRRAIESGLNRLDHGTYAWLLSPVVGVDRVRAGRPLPPLGIATPDAHTLVLRLVRADPTLLHKLALPGTSTPWKADAASGGWEGGIGPYRVARREPGRRMVLARRAEFPGPDTVRVEFAPSLGRMRALLRGGRVDLVWPVPPGALGQPVPEGYRTMARDARPTRRLLLVMRHDVRPTWKVQGRRALAHGLNRASVLAGLGARGVETNAWLAGADPFDYPRRDAAAVREWLSRGRFGRSMHAAMAFAADGVGAEVARAMQTEWAEVALDVELRPLRGGVLANEALSRQGAALLLLETQAPFEDAVTELATLVQPRNAPPVGTFRTGWTTNEFERWLGPQPPETPLDVGYAQRRLGEELVALPLARLPWLWVERSGGSWLGFHPRFGPGVGWRVPVDRAAVRH